ncbi:tetratricopeptide repeat protein [Amycolatopsis sp. EV170708-02-1]|uniref:tetratricopeptide repeat protein n=1 Tax=Amycolatopsis sp. EV170708-02-1 TaxID=2919322 RepID=UPI001F0B82DB|nr:tetratricopeptide repeat protein [Amycolatopsis sp. EV170708-02-1]UMP01356.1 tetratricopeptide repeat protein [Amycolatopsis sp. EV170708-02-1]
MSDTVERDLDLAWELLDAQPTHPRVAELAARVLAAQPERSSASMVLAYHRESLGDTDEARRLYLRVAGRRDSQFIWAARALRHLESADHNHDEALRWARTVLGQNHDDWDDWMKLGSVQALSGAHEEGWRQLDEAVALCARTAPDALPKALAKRAEYLLESLAPPERFAPAAEEAIRVNAADSWVAMLLGYAYLAQYRFDDAEQLGLRLLREDPTDDLLQSLVETARTMLRIVEKARGDDISLADIQGTGVLEMAWQQIRDQKLGVDLASALAALDAVMPDELRATLRPGATSGDLAAGDDKVGSMVARDLLTWHDGQPPGSGAAWGWTESFRLLSAAEILAMDAEIEADRAAHPGWPENELWEQVMTDDAGTYLVAVAFGALVKRRPGQPDEPVAGSMADWIWDRVAAFGGRDPRPAPLKAEEPAADPLPAPGTPLTGVIVTMSAALGAPEDSAAFAELRELFPGSTVRRSELVPDEPSVDGVYIEALDGLVTRVGVDVAVCPHADRLISGLDLGGHRGSVDAYVRAHGAVPQNSWVNRANGEATVVYDFAGHRLGLRWADGSIARIFVTEA